VPEPYRGDPPRPKSLRPNLGIRYVQKASISMCQMERKEGRKERKDYTKDQPQGPNRS
jgi:hypothetical protein